MSRPRDAVIRKKTRDIMTKTEKKIEGINRRENGVYTIYLLSDEIMF